ncbi:MAG: chorismate synthase [Clostridia bacterium]|nr:chorismate synthase [Clostridia bacterium]
MKNIFGNSVSITLFGESHGEAVGVVLDGLAPGLEVDTDYIASQLSLRRPFGKISTARVEADNFKILSGVFEGKTTGTPICIIIPNENTNSRDYSETRAIARPGHADYTAFSKYHGYEDYRGGGHFSGRITAALVAAGAIALTALKGKGIYIGTHILRCAKISDKDFSENLKEEIDLLNLMPFAVLDSSAGEEMKKAIEKATLDRDSVGGVLETAVLGMPSGVGEPWFDTLEGVLSHILFSIPAIKGVEFGLGFRTADGFGSEVNDAFRIENGKIVTKTNNNGGINGGISNGMPIIFRCAVKPTPSIFKAQKTVDFIKCKNSVLELSGRHDPAVVHRARVVVDSVTALALCDVLAGRYGTDYFKE